MAEWISSKHNMGMAFTRKEWKKILSCSTKFCKVSPLIGKVYKININKKWGLKNLNNVFKLNI